MSSTYQDLRNTTFPEQEQDFVEMKDIGPSDAVNVTLYQTAIENNDFAQAANILKNIDNYDSKVLTAKKMNTLFDTCVALQRFYKKEIEPYISEKQKQWLNIINTTEGKNTGYVGVYSSGASYNLNNIVLYQDNLYISTSNYNANVPTDIGHWRALTIQGQDGDPGIGVSFLGEWQSGAVYQNNNIVTYQNNIWISLKNSNTDQPGVGASWEKIYELKSVTIGVSTNDTDDDYWFEELN